MTRTECKELLPAIQHFAKGGNLWAYDGKRWFKQTSIYLTHGYKTSNIIEDKHFEARKAYALGEEVECRHTGCPWIIVSNPDWTAEEYRPKPKEPVYEWQWAYIEYEEYVMSEYHTEEETSEDPDWTKFEPSKRIRK